MLQKPPFIPILAGIALLFIAGSFSPVTAGKEVPVVAALCDALEKQFGVRPAYRRVKKAKDGTITIRGLTTEVKEADAAAKRFQGTFSIEHITLSGVTQQPGGSFEVAEAKLVNLILISDETVEAPSALRLPEVAIKQLHLKPGGGLAPASALLPLGAQAQSAAAQKGMFSSGGASLQIGAIQASWQGDADTGYGRTELKVQDIHYPSVAIKRSDPSGMVLALFGGGDLVFDLEASAITNAAGGTFETTLSARSLGIFKISGTFAGPVSGLLASATPYTQSDATVPAPPVSPAMVSQFAVRFEDQSLTGKLLAMLAADQGVPKEQFIESATAGVVYSMADVKNNTFIEQLKSATFSYLSQPKSFTLKSAPARPITFMTLIEQAASDPAAFLTESAISITAND